MRVSRSAHDGKLVSAESDAVAILQQTSYRGLLVRNLHAKQLSGVQGELLQQLLVFCTDFHLQTISAIDIGIAEVMVQMSVRGYQMDGLQLIVVDILANRLKFLVVVCPTIDDDTLAALVAHHVAVLLQRVALYSLNFEH